VDIENIITAKGNQTDRRLISFKDSGPCLTAMSYGQEGLFALATHEKA
jgi:hypothetical protein